MSDPVPSSAIYDATTGGRSVIVITGGSTGDVLTLQSNGTYAAATPSAATPGGSSGEIQYNNAGSFGGAVAVVYAGSGTHVVLTAQATTTIPLAVKAASSQTANLQEWRNSSDTAMTVVDELGYIGIGTATPLDRIHIGTGAGNSIRFETNLSVGSTHYWGLNWHYLGTCLAFFRGYQEDSSGGMYVSIATNTSNAGTFERLRVAGNGAITIPNVTASVIPLAVRAAASQSANLQEWRNSSSAVLSAVAKNGAFKTASLADSAAENGTIYYSTDASKLVFKDSGGVVNNLY